jgi:hypothetical protein
VWARQITIDLRLGIGWSPEHTDGRTIANIGAAVVENPLAHDASRQFRQVMISVPGDQQQMPIGLRVPVQFSPCVSGQSGPGK